MNSDPRGTKQQRRWVRLEVEALEARELPSASPLIIALEAKLPPALQTFDIVGTGATMNQQGLPASMSGNLYYGPHQLGQLVGQYHETLTPLLFDGFFIGTTGVATFTIGPQTGQPLETIRTMDVSLLQGYDPASGALLVASNGVIFESAGLTSNIQGGFSSASAVVLGPQFASLTNVDFQAIIAGLPSS